MTKKDKPPDERPAVEKTSNTDRARRVVEEHLKELRQIIEKLREHIRKRLH